MRIQIASTVLAASLILVPVATASAATDEPMDVAPVAEATETAEGDDDGDEGLWGLAGLLGLIGLAGLKRRKDADYDNRSGGTVR